MTRLALALALALTFSSGAAAGTSWSQIRKAGVLRAATEGAFRPFNFKEGDELSGFEVDLVNAIARQLKLKVQWTSEIFDNLLTDLSKRRFDLVAASHAITPERAKSVEFISPHYCSGAIIVTRKGGPSTLAALEGKIVGAGDGTTYHDRLKGMSRFKELRGFKEDADAVDALSAGRIAAWVTDRFVANAVVHSPRGANLDLGDMVFPEMVAMAVPKGENELRDKVDGALAALMRDGTYEKISLRYFNSDIRCRELSRRRRAGTTGF